MHNTFSLRVVALGAFAVLCLCMPQDEALAAALNTANFVAACSADENVTSDPGFEDSKVTPKAFCECVAAEVAKNKLSQADVDMLTKMHKDDISDADAESYPTLEDLMNANEGFEDSCRTSLGLPIDEGTDIEEVPLEDDGMPEEEEAPAEDDGSPPE
ncbi:MAG TPA: hypothetical protein VHK26_00525 [Methyloceanibacter sp.]|jgi:hypothetical protein|nr:hypothetical protein [Methyloceanibacter sp.]